MKYVKKLLVLIGSIYLLAIGIMALFQEKLIFLPTTLDQDYRYTFEQPFEEFWLEHPDGARLNGLHFKAAHPKGVILYFHGNSGDLSRWGTIASEFTQFDLDVVVMDYRTYGKSRGTLGEQAMYEDANLFYKYAAQHFQESEIYVYGRSLGTTFASFVAARNNPKRLLLETPFYSLKHVASKRYWFLPVSTLLKYTFPSNQYLKEVSCETTLFHGTEDRVVPYENSVKIKENLLELPLELVTIPGGSHNDLIDFESYRTALQQALD